MISFISSNKTFKPNRASALTVVGVLCASIVCGGQTVSPPPTSKGPTPKAAAFLPPISMPPDRGDDSYRIYSMLMPGAEFSGSNWPHGLWLIDDITVGLVTSDQPCIPDTASGSRPFIDAINPHSAITPPADRKQDFKDLLDDFDRHCHERIQLSAERFKLPVPFRLITDSEQAEFMSTRFRSEKTPIDPAILAKYKGAPGISSFSQIFFNPHHTMAMVYATQWCGVLCAQGAWIVLELQDGQWRPLRWTTSSWVS